MKIKLAALLAVVAISLCIAAYIKGDNNYSKDFYEPLLLQPLDSVVERGIDHLYAGQPDSAMAYFSVVAGRYNESLSRADKIVCAKAFNSKGYVEFFEQGQIGASLISLMKAEQIEKETGDSTWLPLIYLNMANVLTYSNDIDRVISLFRKTTDLALEAKAWRTYLTAFRNLVFQTIMERDINSIERDLKRFASLDIPQANMREFSECLYHGGMAIGEKRWDDAYRFFLKADSVNDSELAPDRSHIMSVFLRSRMLELKGENRLAIEEIQKNLPDFQNDQISSAYLFLSRLYGSIGDRTESDRYRLMYYEKSDSLGILAPANQIASARSQFNLDKMSGEVTRLEVRRNAWATTAIVCLLSAIALSVALVLVVRSRKKLHKSQDELYLKNKAIIETSNCENAASDDGEGRRILEILEKSPEIFEIGFSIEKAAALTGLHSRNISKALNSAFQKNFNTVVQELRIKEACRILASPATADSLNMTEIAARLGFKSRTYFSEVFKKQTGLTPTEYMRSAKRAGK